MYYETVNKMDARTDASASLRSPADLPNIEFLPLNMARAADNFRRMSAEAASVKKGSRAQRSPEEIIPKFFGIALMLGIGMVSVPTDATARSPIACGTTYTVARGDTLFKIADRAFGNGKLYKQIFEANRDILPNSASVEIGNEIQIPCLDSAGQIVRVDEAQDPPAEPANPEVNMAALEEPTQAPSNLLRQAAQLVAMATFPTQSIAGPANPSVVPASITKDMFDTTEPATSEPQLAIHRIRLLTGSGLEPYADENLPEGGMITDLVSRALNAAAPGQQSSVDFVNDWASHLNYLLPEGAFDVSFPWYKPDCSKADKLNTEIQKRCAEFEFSIPIFEVRVGFYTQAGNALVETGTLAALIGKRLCRPSGHFTFDLEQVGLVEPNVSIKTQYSAKECFVRLVKGQVDVVTMVKSEGDEQLRQLGVAKAVTEIGDLESVQTLHALVSKQNPNGLTHLELINRGLAELMASGKWFEVVASHQSRQLALMN